MKFVPTFLFFEICTAILLEAADRKGIGNVAEVRLWQRITSVCLVSNDGNCSSLTTSGNLFLVNV